MTAGIPWQPWSAEAAADLRASGEIFLGCWQGGPAPYATLRWSVRFHSWVFEPRLGGVLSAPTHWARIQPPAEPEMMAA